MRTQKTIPLSIVLFLCLPAMAQVRVSDATLSVYTGMVNYEGDLKPNSFTFNHSNFFLSAIFRKPLNKWISWRSGISIGKIEGADRYNRDYLKPRNLSFYTNIKEIHTGFGVNLLDIAKKWCTPYAYAAIALYHFDPYTYDNNNKKVYLKPLSTEGQGLPEYPHKKPYKLTQIAVAFGGGFKYAITDFLNLGIEFSQRKTFTDYLDDVSGYFPDQDVLLQHRGPKAVELSYRGDELPNGEQLFPQEGAQRGTHTEMDWYYFFGVTIEMRIGKIKDLFSNDRSFSSSSSSSYRKFSCPHINF